MQLTPQSAIARPVIADISSYEVKITSDFTGIELNVFGARQSAGDVVVLVRGEEHDFVVRKKEQVGPIWINNQEQNLLQIPEFYFIASSADFDKLKENTLFRNLALGREYSALLTKTTQQNDISDKQYEFFKAFLNERLDKSLYQRQNDIIFMGDTLFKTVIPFPDNVPKGHYQAEIYLFQGNELIAMQIVPLSFKKSGIDYILYNLAHEYSAVYGIMAILIAMLAGWLAGVIFNRR